MNYILCLHRWAGTQALYDQYTLADETIIRAICTSEAVASLPQKRCESYAVVPSMDDNEGVLNAAKKIVAEFGPPKLVVGLNEGDLINAANIRELYCLPGDNVTWAARFRDKVKMNNIAEGQDAFPILSAATVISTEQVHDFANKHGYPVVVKPKFGTASRGVRVIRNKNDFAGGRKHLATEPMMVQAYCDAPTLHIDGWWDGEQLVVATASRYLNNCMQFGPSKPLGSVELANGDEEDQILLKVGKLLAVFSPRREMVFHLELFDCEHELLFLEIAARVGGAEIPFVWRDVHRIDLVGIAWEIQVGKSTGIRDAARLAATNGHLHASERGGWVIGSAPSSGVVAAESVYWSMESNPKNRASGVYEGAGSRVRLRGGDHANLVRDAQICISELSVPDMSQSSCEVVKALSIADSYPVSAANCAKPEP
ncbi:MAG: biotin carboxylase [Rhodobacteraceae bacterium]|nr:biotin carboxylase [Paracoccaceae bacterium]